MQCKTETKTEMKCGRHDRKSNRVTGKWINSECLKVIFVSETNKYCFRFRKTIIFLNMLISYVPIIGLCRASRRRRRRRPRRSVDEGERDDKRERASARVPSFYSFVL